MVTAELLLHPVRMRIAQAVLDGRPVTTTELRRRLPDVSAATIYRHVALLVEAGILEVVDERRVRGAVERTYRVHREAAQLDPEDVAALSPADHRRYFGTFVTGLLADFDRYLGDRPHVDARAEHVAYRQAAVWLDDDEVAALQQEIQNAVMARTVNEPTEARKRYVISLITLPDAG